ncbi:MAG: type II 3-dehydroquinate dehydratase [Gammaproteobacteria bacterium RIFCSPHIGHO2_12_FULL_35_23]|nr:MAG: type II 3-dehydroquinate dehydratase [Gammaproteobacteria bacterium RIFCSPHIGHO2_12_FULL_35_23]
MTKILILNGPNLNLLGSREPDTYGSSTLGEINTQLQALATHPLVFFQSNAEHELLEKIQQAPSQDIKFIIFNPAAFTHSSIALRDALLAIQIPFIEVHLSNIYAREIFRHQSYFSDIAYGTLTGFGPLGYQLALKAAEHYLARE